MNSILAAFDFSDASVNALNYAVRMADYFGSRLVLLHAWHQPVNAYETAYLDQAFFQIRDEVDEMLNAKKKEIQINYPLLEIEVISKSGLAFDCIETTIKEKDIDLTIVGITGSGGFIKKKIIGSTAIKVARKLNCPSIIVPENYIYKSIKRIAYACDYEQDPSASSLMIQVKLYASLFHAEVKVVNVTSDLLILKDTTALSKAKLFVDQKLSPIDHSTVTIKDSSVVEGLSNYLNDEQVDLLILQPLRHGFFHRFFREEVTPELAFNTPVPLLILHD